MVVVVVLVKEWRGGNLRYICSPNGGDSDGGGKVDEAPRFFLYKNIHIQLFFLFFSQCNFINWHSYTFLLLLFRLLLFLLHLLFLLFLSLRLFLLLLPLLLIIIFLLLYLLFLFSVYLHLFLFILISHFLPFFDFFLFWDFNYILTNRFSFTFYFLFLHLLHYSFSFRWYCNTI